MSASPISAGVTGCPAPHVPQRPGALDRAQQAGLASLGFFLPFSTAGVSLSVLALLVCAALGWRSWREERPWREPVVAWGLLLWTYVALRTWPSEAVSWAALHQYRELLLLPVFWVLMRRTSRPEVFIVGLLSGSAFMALLYLLNAAPWADSGALKAWLAQRRISAGFVLALAAFVAWEAARLSARRRRLLGTLSLGLAATVLFAIDGRTAHLVLLLLAVFAAFRTAVGRWKGPTTVLVLAGVLALASQSEAVRSRLYETREAARAAQTGASTPTSSGIRYEIWRNALRVIDQHPFVGTGWGTAYTRAFAEANRDNGQRLNPAFLPTANPHSELLFQWGAGGLPALALFLVWVSLPVWRAWRQPDAPYAGAMVCVALAFALGSTVNSMLWDFTEAHVYVALLAFGLRLRPRCP